MCNDCNETKPDLCGCKNKVDLKCTTYTGATLDPLHILEGMNGEEIIKIINDYLKDLIIDLDIEPTILENVGTGYELYKGFSEERRHELRTILKGSGINIETVGNDELKISVDKTFVENNSKINLQNVGSGTPLFKGVENNVYKLRKIKSSNNTVGINIADNNESIDLTVEIPEIPTIDYPVVESQDIGLGASLRKDVVGKKIGIRTLESDDIIISESTSGSIKLSLPGGGSSSNDFYLDPYFVRPLDWEIRTNPEEILNTAIRLTPRKVASGKLNDPFKDYEEFLLKAIGPELGSNANGRFTRSNPRTYGLLQILNSIETTQQLEINNWVIKFVNSIILNYEGNQEYALDMRRLWTPDTIDSVTGMVKRNITMEIRGEGVLTRSSGYGLIYSKGDALKTTPQIIYQFVLRGSGSGIKLQELEYNAGNVRLTRADNTTPLSNGNSPILGRVQQMTTPLVVIDGSSNGFWGTLFYGNIFIVANTQTHLKLINKGELTHSNGSLKVQVGNTYIGYKRKMIENAPGNTLAENQFLTSRRSNGDTLGFFYEPQDDYVVFDIQGQSNFRIEKFESEPNGFIHSAANSLFRIGDGSTLNNPTSFTDTGGCGAINLITAQGNNQYIALSNFNLQSNMYRLFKGTGSNSIIVDLNNVTLNQSTLLKEGLVNLNIRTGGTYCVIKGRPIISLEYQQDNAGAISAGYEKNMLYRTPTGDVAQVY